MKTCTRPFLWKKPSSRLRCLLLAAAFSARAALAQDGYWVGGGGGSWSDPANWDAANGMAGGADNTAYFGFSRESALSSQAWFTLDGPQTIGNLVFTTQGGPASWKISPGAGGSLTLDNTFGAPKITVTSPSLQVTLGAAITGGSGIEKDGPGSLVLSGQNTYTGQTVVNGGGLNVTGSVANGGVAVNNAFLAGSGTIGGPVVIGAGGTLSLGGASGPMTINNSLVLMPGSTTTVTLDGSGRPAVQGLSGVTCGGTLIVNNLSGALSLGQSFSLFGGATVNGNFSNIQPPPGPWLRWRFDPSTGQISVVSSGSQPAFAGVNLSGGNVVCNVTSGPPGSPCYIVASTDLNLPKSEWTRIGTNVFDMSGNFTFTNGVNGNGACQIFLATYVTPTP
jgi:autotransporter-associated beta strand protein